MNIRCKGKISHHCPEGRFKDQRVNYMKCFRPYPERVCDEILAQVQRWTRPHPLGDSLKTELSTCSVNKLSAWLLQFYGIDHNIGRPLPGFKINLIHWSHLLYPYFAFKSFTTLVFPPESEVGSLSSKPAK